MNTVREFLFQKQEEYGIAKKIFYDEDSKNKFRELLKNKEPLPDNVYRSYDGTFYGMKKRFTEEEAELILKFYKLSYLKTIKNSVLFFVILTSISLLVGLIIALI